VLLASLLTFGFRGTMHRFTAGIDEAREFINDRASIDHLIKVGRKQIADAEERLLDAESTAKSYHKQEERVRSDIAQLQQAASVGRSRLATLRPAITTNASFQHAGCSYSAADVKQDAVQLATFVKGCDEQVAAKQAELKDLQQNLVSGDNVLGDARKEFTKAQSHIRELEIRLTQQQAVADATAAARAARDGVSAELGGDFASTVGALEKRLSKLQRQNESLRTSAGGVPNGNIPFTPTSTVDAESLINEVLGTSKPAPTTAQAN
jgi:DNA repair exonuclease SbcCD ATPase subunit